MNQLSRTCVLVAAARAFGSREPDPAVRNPDYLAGQLLRPEDIDLIEGHPLRDAYAGDYEAGVDNFGVLGIVWMMLIRTRFIDAALQKAVADGVTQVAILGAGLDTRAYRFGDLLQGCKVVEADAAPTQQYKLARLKEVASLPDSVSYAEINLIHDDLTQVLERAGLNRHEKTFFILEGVSMYLTEEEVAHVLKQIASFGAPGSRLALDYKSRNDEMSRSVPHGADLMATWGEPWKDGIPSEPGRRVFP